MFIVTWYAQPAGNRSTSSVQGSVTLNAPLALRVTAIGLAIITTSLSSTTVTVGVNVITPRAGVLAGVM